MTSTLSACCLCRLNMFPRTMWSLQCGRWSWWVLRWKATRWVIHQYCSSVIRAWFCLILCFDACKLIWFKYKMYFLEIVFYVFFIICNNATFDHSCILVQSENIAIAIWQIDAKQKWHILAIVWPSFNFVSSVNIYEIWDSCCSWWVIGRSKSHFLAANMMSHSSLCCKMCIISKLALLLWAH